MITVFYDGKCSWCRREIEHYKRIAPSDVFVWEDITVNTAAIEKLDISYAEALRQLHVLDEQGQVHVGVDAFIIIWKQLKRWRALATIVSIPFVQVLVKLAYRAFAKWRFKQLSHCQLALRNDDSTKN